LSAVRGAPAPVLVDVRLLCCLWQPLQSRTQHDMMLHLAVVLGMGGGLPKTTSRMQRMFLLCVLSLLFFFLFYFSFSFTFLSLLLFFLFRFVSILLLFLFYFSLYFTFLFTFSFSFSFTVLSLLLFFLFYCSYQGFFSSPLPLSRIGEEERELLRRL
jgi:hypothetical protein